MSPAVFENRGQDESGAAESPTIAKRNRWRVAASLTAFSVIVLAACTSPSDEGAGEAGGTDGGDEVATEVTTTEAGGATELVVAIPGAPAGVDPDRHSGPMTWALAPQLFELGFEWERVADPFEGTPGLEPGQIEGFTWPALIEAAGGPEYSENAFESCQLNEDATEGTITIRPGILSAAGNEFTADDILYDVERAVANAAAGLFMLSSASTAPPTTWEKVDKYTVAVTGETPMPLLCDIQSNFYYLAWQDSTAFEENADSDDPWANEWAETNGGGFGPYHVVEWDPSTEIVMEANPNYWKGEPAIKRIRWRIVPESAARLALLVSGDVDIALGLPPEAMVGAGEAEGVTAAAVRGNMLLYGIMNNEKPPFDDVNVRRAINMAIPRQEIVDGIYRGMANAWQGVMPSVYPGYEEFDQYTYNLERARELMAASRYPDGASTTLVYNQGDPVQESVAVLLQTSLSAIGIDVTLRGLPPGPLSDVVISKESEFALWFDFPIQPDPIYSLNLLYRTGVFTNYQSYSNPDVDAMIDEAKGIVDPAERISRGREIQKLVHDDAPVAWILEPNYMIGIRDEVAGLGWYPTQYFKVSEMSIGE